MVSKSFRGCPRPCHSLKMVSDTFFEPSTLGVKTRLARQRIALGVRWCSCLANRGASTLSMSGTSDISRSWFSGPKYGVVGTSLRSSLSSPSSMFCGGVCTESSAPCLTTDSLFWSGFFPTTIFTSSSLGSKSMQKPGGASTWPAETKRSSLAPWRTGLGCGRSGAGSGGWGTDDDDWARRSHCCNA